MSDIVVFLSKFFHFALRFIRNTIAIYFFILHKPIWKFVNINVKLS